MSLSFRRGKGRSAYRGENVVEVVAVSTNGQRSWDQRDEGTKYPRATDLSAECQEMALNGERGVTEGKKRVSAYPRERNRLAIRIGSWPNLWEQRRGLLGKNFSRGKHQKPNR